MSYTNRYDDDCEIEIGEELHEVTFTRVTTCTYDPDYGADADGHRGVPRTFIDEDYAEDICVDGKELKEYPEDFQKHILKEVDAYIGNSDPKCEEPEPVCDDLGDDE
jgi:hypothetical protein